MAPSIIYAKATTTLTTSSNPTIRRTLISSRVHRNRNVTVRSLWWWGRHGSWSSTSDENLEERFQRHQKIMRHRYSRTLRRKAMWDREESSPSWLSHYDGHVGRRWGACRAISSTDTTAAKVQEKNELPSDYRQSLFKAQRDMNGFDKDFEAFKAAIDRAVDRDPYGAVFGRRLQSPPTENNSSWISWLFNLGETPQEPSTNASSASSKRKIEIEVLDKEQPTKQAYPPIQPKANVVISQTTVGSETVREYVYDPISGRKVLKSDVKSQTPAQAAQTFLEALFSEHGAPPATVSVKHHKVYGHDGKAPKLSTHPDKVDTTAFESSRKREYQQLRATTIGNSIDTTAEFGGKFAPQTMAEDETGVEKIRTLLKPEDDAIPFSGTTYESKMSEPKQTSKTSQSSWLAKEGFQSQRTEKLQKPQENRLESSFDRMSNSLEPKAVKFVTKLQPALDRVHSVKRAAPPHSATEIPITSTTESQSRNVPVSRQRSEADTTEDMDLLRASDIRAATKSARTTKQEVVLAKMEKRNRLENDFDQLQQRQVEETVPDAKQLRADSDRLSRSIERVRQHAAQHSDGLVAKTIQSLGIAGKEFKLFEEPSEKGSLEKLSSIYKPSSRKLDNSTQQFPESMENDEKMRVARTEILRSASRIAEQIRKRDDAQILQLASGIRQVYEAEHGPIDLSLAQNSAATSTAKEECIVSDQSKKDTTAMATAPTTSLDFFVERTRFLKETDKLANHLSIIKAKTADLEVKMDGKSIQSPDASAKAEALTAEAKTISDKADRLESKIDQFIARDKAEGVKDPHPLSQATVKLGVPRYPNIERHTHMFEPKYIQLLQGVKSMRISLREIGEGIDRLEQDRKNNASEHKIKISEPSLQKPVTNTISSTTVEAATKVKAEPDVLSSPYLILVYNKTTGEVDQTPIERLPWSGAEKPEKASPIRVMGNLNYPAAFVTHFVELEKAGYELSSGGGDMLIFQKKSSPSPVQPVMDGKSPLVSASETLRNAIAAEESIAQPEITDTIAQPNKISSKQAATVLEDIPADIPTPGPAAPTAPTPASSSSPPADNQPKKAPRSGTRVRRQEQVFSGTLPLRSGSPAQSPRPQHKAKPNNNETNTANSPPTSTSSSTTTTSSSSTTNDEKSHSSSSSTHSDPNPNPNIFTRTTRTLKRGVLGVTAFGVAAYTIGVVAEGIGAQAQVEGDTITGPRRKIVMPSSSSSNTTTTYGQRPGIYSTESSRD